MDSITLIADSPYIAEGRTASLALCSAILSLNYDTMAREITSFVSVPPEQLAYRVLALADIGASFAGMVGHLMECSPLDALLAFDNTANAAGSHR